MSNVTLLDIPIRQTVAERRAIANYSANHAALLHTQPSLAAALLPPREQVEWVFGRDGALTARGEDENWWSGTSLPRAAAKEMLKKMDLLAPASCFLAPPHAAHLRVALDKFGCEQVVIAVVPQEEDLRLILSCEDFSADLAEHRLWFAAGPSWAQMMESLFEKETGLPVPAQFLRLLSIDESLMQELIEQATQVFSRLTQSRSAQIGQLNREYGETKRPARGLCAMTPLRFGLWDGEGPVLASLAPENAVRFDTSDPARTSPLKLAKQASECGALLAPNFARADLPHALPAAVPWHTWITHDRVPSFALAGPYDRLLIAAPSVHAAAIAEGWPADRVQLAGWPQISLPDAKGPRLLTVLADTRSVTTPEDLEDFSSHRVLWETIRAELSHNPFALEGDPRQYLIAQMRRFDVSTEAFPLDRFVKQLIMPAYQQGVLRALLKAGMPLRLHGEGWSEIAEFQSFAAGPIRSGEQVSAALASAAVLVDLWPWRSAHPMSAANRHIVRREGRSMTAFVQRARSALAASTTPALPGTPQLSAEMIADLLR